MRDLVHPQFLIQQMLAAALPFQRTRIVIRQRNPSLGLGP